MTPLLFPNREMITVEVLNQCLTQIKRKSDPKSFYSEDDLSEVSIYSVFDSDQLVELALEQLTYQEDIGIRALELELTDPLEAFEWSISLDSRGFILKKSRLQVDLILKSRDSKKGNILFPFYIYNSKGDSFELQSVIAIDSALEGISQICGIHVG